jgi:hypothetical protein
MDFSALILMLAAKYPVVMLVCGLLGVLVVAGQAVVLLTPTKKDDEALEGAKKNAVVAAVLNALAAFAPISKK